MSTSFDFGSKIKAAYMLASAWDGDADVTSDAFDTSGAEGAAIVFTIGTVTAGANIEVVLHEGDADDFTPGAGNVIPENYLINAPEIDDTANTAYVLSFKANKRYVKAVVSRAGTDAAGIAATGVLGYLDNIPV